MRPLRRALVLLPALALCLAGLAVPASAGDDYPWRLDETWTSDAHGFTKRQCVSFVAWRLAQRSAPLDNGQQAWGSARTWDDAARRLGHGVGTRPVVGAVAQWDAGEVARTYSPGVRRASGLLRAGGHGHVGYVQHVHTDGTATIEHYNGTGSRTYATARVRAPRYLYVAVPAPR